MTTQHKIKFITHNDTAENIDVNGTHLQGEIDASYRTLERIFGEPDESDQYKTDARWYIKFADGTISTVYNYKDGKNYQGPDGIPTHKIRNWHIGGYNDKAVKKVIEAIKADGGGAADDAADAAEDKVEDKVEVERIKAAFIIKAVNCHDELVELLSIAIDFRKNPEGVGYEGVKAFIEKVDTVLSRAKGA